MYAEFAEFGWVFTRRVTGSRLIRHRLGEEPLELCALLLQGLPTLRVDGILPAELGFPGMERSFRHAVPPAQLRRLRISLMLPRNAYDLLFYVFQSLSGPDLPRNFSPNAIKVRPDLRTDNEAKEIYGRTDHRHFG